MPHNYREYHFYEIPEDSKDTIVVGPKSTKVVRGKDTLREVPTKDFIKNLQPVVDSGMLPAAVRWISRDFLDIVVERPPRQAQMFFYPGSARAAAGKDRESLLVNIPWTVTTIHFSQRHAKVDGVYMYFMQKPLTSLEETLGVAPLPNLSKNSVCMDEAFHGDFVKFRKTKGITLTDMIHFVMHRIWETGFNYNAGEVTGILPPGLESDNLGTTLHKWQELNMSEVLAIRWAETGTLQNHLKNIRSQGRLDEKGIAFAKATLATS